MTTPEDEFDMDAHLILETADGELRLDRFNSVLVTFIGDLAVYDYVFVQTEARIDEAAVRGMYIFQENEHYEVIADYMWDNDFPMHLNTACIEDCDRAAYLTTALQDLDDFVIPDDWQEAENPNRNPQDDQT